MNRSYTCPPAPSSPASSTPLPLPSPITQPIYSPRSRASSLSKFPSGSSPILPHPPPSSHISHLTSLPPAPIPVHTASDSVSSPALNTRNDILRFYHSCATLLTLLDSPKPGVHVPRSLQTLPLPAPDSGPFMKWLREEEGIIKVDKTTYSREQSPSYVHGNGVSTLKDLLQHQQHTLQTTLGANGTVKNGKIPMKRAKSLWFS